ncbi:MarR family winged helix-turn-helix transcriptional regulator [Cellulomonas palmilytica]|uniref:MarR family winged helix-turn-helix transcriptional regulator n=1 Tax=Cellulomonas palmilytica TaxID=2608402 RepID=UPI001F46C5E2|nr:MarR family transcriptional regulator [Cellulomonas palmilytica]UJP41166.1 MarR family transcriptional regulator [Cellulomonas palmilytica]
MEPAIADVERQVALLLRLADRNRRRSRRLEGTLERSAYLALGRLADGGPAGINEIADHLRLDASTVTRQVLQMEALGYVSRSRDDNDARRSVIDATPDGLAALEATRRARADVYAEVLADWTPDDLQTLATSLTRLNASLDASLDASSATAARP